MRPRKLKGEEAALLTRCLGLRRQLTDKALSQRFDISPASFKTYRAPRETMEIAKKLTAADLDELAARLSDP